MRGLFVAAVAASGIMLLLAGCVSENSLDVIGGNGNDSRMETLHENDITRCIPECDGKACGSDGCGGVCGICSADKVCIAHECVCPGSMVLVENECVCIPMCVDMGIDMECGPDGCGGYCGNGVSQTKGCPEGCYCFAGKCHCRASCSPECDGGFVCMDGECQEATCSLVLQCNEFCDAGGGPIDVWLACFDACVTSVPIDVILAYNDFFGCMIDHCHGYFDDQPNPYDAAICDGQCVDEYYACWPPGDGNCLDLLSCTMSCPPSEWGETSTCAYACYPSASIEASQQYAVLLSCWLGQGLDSCPDGDNPCYWDTLLACSEELALCAEAEWSCEEMLDCVQSCPLSSDWWQCAFLPCFAHGTPAAQEMFVALLQCTEAQCPDVPLAECLASLDGGECSDAATTCMVAE